MNKKAVECFVPAKALEHTGNSEHANLHEKIRMAIIRYHLTGDFFAKITVPYTTPGVYIEKKIFDPCNLGYKVSAVIRC